MSDQYGQRAATAVVTGASSGIGAATCKKLRADGWHVVGLARRRSSHADLSLRVDVASPEQVEAAFAGIADPRLVIHAAGMIGPIDRVSDFVSIGLIVVLVSAWAVRRKGRQGSPAGGSRV